MPYPWNEDDVLVAADLNAAIAGVTANAGRVGPQGPPGALIQSGYGPPTADAPDGTTYFDLSNGDVWTFGEPGGGGGAPDWVPANAVIHIDLVGGSPQGRAWVDGVGEVAIDTLLGSDPNTVNGFSSTEYNPANLTENGYVYNNEGDAQFPLGFIGAARTKILDVATLVWKTYTANTDDPSSTIAQVSSLGLTSADGIDAIEIDIQAESLGGSMAYSWNGSATGESDGVTNDAFGSFNQTAATVTSSRLEFALNGSAVLALVLDETDRPLANPLVAALLDSMTPFTAIQFITFYDPLPTTAGLSELSEAL